MEFQRNNFENDEFDLDGILEKLIRKKNLFLKVFFSTIFISLLYAYIKPPTWEGKFEILISDKETVTSAFGRLSSLNPGLADLVSKSQFGPRLKTEVKILESPSVLKPAFEFYKNEKIKINPKFKKLRYEKTLNSSNKISIISNNHSTQGHLFSKYHKIGAYVLIFSKNVLGSGYGKSGSEEKNPPPFNEESKT